MKKTILFAMLGLVVASTVLESCKKGEGDPAISFRSRKSRMAGDWKLKSGTSKDVNGNTTVSSVYDGTNNAYTVTIGSTSTTGTETYTLEWKIEKDGTFESILVEGSGTNVQTTTQKGRWNFAGKIGDFKNKDHAIFYVDSDVSVQGTNTTTNTYTGDQNSMVVELNTLKNKELVAKTTYTNTNTGGTDSSDNEWHFEQ